MVGWVWWVPVQQIDCSRRELASCLLLLELASHHHQFGLGASVQLGLLLVMLLEQRLLLCEQGRGRWHRMVRAASLLNVVLQLDDVVSSCCCARAVGSRGRSDSRVELPLLRAELSRTARSISWCSFSTCCSWLDFWEARKLWKHWSAQLSLIFALCSLAESRSA